jgi:hypothetical protein
MRDEKSSQKESVGLKVGLNKIYLYRKGTVLIFHMGKKHEKRSPSACN